MSSKKGTKKLNKLDIKKETIADLNVKDAEQVKGGTIASAPPHCPPKPIGKLPTTSFPRCN
ncbi:MAG: class I lanthipeptide [Blastocatellia bacterium]